MAPFYLLLVLLGLLLARLLVQVFGGAGGRLRGAPFERQTLLPELERAWLARLAQAAGPGYRVWPMVAPHALLRPERGLPPGQRALAQAVLRAGVIDFLVVAGAGDPVCVVQLLPERQTRARRRLQRRLIDACGAAGLPVVELPRAEASGSEPGSEADRAALGRLIQDAIALAPRLQPGSAARDAVPPASAAASAPPDADEEDALARLSAALREPDGLDQR